MLFINLKYQRYFDSIDEENLSEQISYWFFTSLLHVPRTIKSNKFLLSNVITHDKEIKNWYMEFINEVKKLYVTRLLEINNLKI